MTEENRVYESRQGDGEVAQDIGDGEMKMLTESPLQGVVTVLRWTAIKWLEAFRPNPCSR